MPEPKSVHLLTAEAPPWEEIARELEAQGWQVTAREVWALEARRGGETEEVLGATRQQAWGRLRELLRLYGSEHLP
jgi:hypothetical protein